MNSFTSASIRPNVPRPRISIVTAFIARNINKLPFIAIHFLALAVFFVPASWEVVGLCVGLYFLRMFSITAGYHRYFAHRSFKTSRPFQFVLACLGCTATQKGPLWWSANHRAHHKYSDTDNDPHSPVSHSVFWAHIGWVLYEPHDPNAYQRVKDFAKYPELRLLDRLHFVPPLIMAVICYALYGWSGVVWGYFVSTVLLYHGTFLVNSVCHLFGKRRYKTKDESKNNAIVAILTMGEGWHNNHHHYQSSANQGFRWWEIDLSYYMLCLLCAMRLVWDLRKPPQNKLVPTI